MKKAEGIIKILFWFALIIGGITLSVYLDNNVFKIFVDHESILYYFFFIPGVFLLIMVLNISKNIGRFLAKNAHDTKLPKGEINQLLTTGPYAVMRHPMHLGLMFFPVSVALISTSISLIFLIAPAQILIIFILIKVIEEPQQIKKFGKAYESYMKNVPMFCLRKECIEVLLKSENL